MADPNDAYRSMVADAVRARGATSSPYQPEMKRDLRICDVHRPRSVEELCPEELLHLRAVLGKKLETHLLDREMATECACVRDEGNGEVVLRLYGWGHGSVFLFEASRVCLVAHATQHTVEVWSSSQRPLFFEMDAALRRGDHGLEQPIAFEWWHEDAWDEVRDAEPGTVGSQPWLTDLLGS
jgi:hypothetical protein